MPTAPGRRWQAGFGLYQGDKLSAQANDAYNRALNALLLPRLLSRLETQMQANLGNTDFLYQALKVYLILGRQGPLDPGLVTALDATPTSPRASPATQQAGRATRSARTSPRCSNVP